VSTQLDNNVVFYIYKETIRKIIHITTCIPPQVVEAYNPVACFKAGHHHICVQAKKDPNQECMPTQYRLTKEEMGHIMEYWTDDWKIPSTETNKPETQ
jgi:hypothetical protein